MRYLFFDVECSNCFGGIGKLCEFGYVITDEKFHILDSDAIPMSPGREWEDKFDFGIYDRDPDFDWAYDPETYYDCPEFNEYYDEIRHIFNHDDLIILGYSVDNDIRYINNTCDRYHLPYWPYIAYDAQRIMKDYLPDQHRRLGLQKAFVAMCGEEALKKMQGHLSRDDSIMTMRVVEAICKQLEVSLPELLSLCPKCRIDSLEYYENYKQERANKEVIHQLFAPDKECQKIWVELYQECWPLLEEDSSIGRFVTISGTIKKDLDICTKVCEKIRADELVAYDGLSGSDYFICQDENDIETIKKALKFPYRGKYVIAKDFLEDNYKQDDN